MSQLVRRFLELQRIDREIGELARELAELPGRVEKQRLEGEILQANHERSRKEIMRLQSEANRLADEVAAGEELLRKYTTQLNIAKTNKEYNAIKNQVAAQKAFNGKVETKALEALEELERRQEQARQLAAQVEAQKKELEQLRARAETGSVALRKRLEALQKERTRKQEGMDAEYLELYERAHTSRGEALARLQGRVCGACFIQLPPQTYNEVLTSASLVLCPSCGRLLYAEPAHEAAEES